MNRRILPIFTKFYLIRILQYLAIALKLEKDKKRLSQMRKETSGKRELENARKEESKLSK